MKKILLAVIFFSCTYIAGAQVSNNVILNFAAKNYESLIGSINPADIGKFGFKSPADIKKLVCTKVYQEYYLVNNEVVKSANYRVLMETPDGIPCGLLTVFVEDNNELSVADYGALQLSTLLKQNQALYENATQTYGMLRVPETQTDYIFDATKSIQNQRNELSLFKIFDKQYYSLSQLIEK